MWNEAGVRVGILGEGEMSLKLMGQMANKIACESQVGRY